MEQYTMRPAGPDDLDEIWALVGRAVNKMQAEGSVQWGDDYPHREDYAEDIAAGELYVAVAADGDILGAACVNTSQDPTYAEVAWTAPDPAMVIHRMAVDPAAQRRGVASALFQYAEDLAKNRGLPSMRVDTYSQNSGMQELFRRRGYVQRGEIRLHARPLPFPAFEKVF